MSKLLQSILPQPPVDYNQSQFNQLIKVLQAALGINVETKLDADEREAINYFLSN